MAAQLPGELIVEILSMLPAKSLLRCRLVCKSWLSLINSTKFKLMHIHNFNQLNPRYLVRRLDWDVAKEWYDVHFDDEAFTVDRGNHVEFPFDGSRVNYCFKIVGCCNGVVCLSDDDFAISTLDKIILWNPSIRRKLTLTGPSFYPIKFKESYAVLGFGYDKISDDYKVVSLVYADGSSIRPKVDVYTVKTGIWREITFRDDFSCFFVLPNWSQVFFNGCVHWIAYDPTTTTGVSRNSIMTFDISTELFGQIQLPELLAKEYSLTMVVSVVGESLAVIYYSGLKVLKVEPGSTCKVWVMKEYQNPTSWTMIYNMYYPDINIGVPLQLRNNGDMIIESIVGEIIIHNHNVGYYVYASSICTENDLDCRTYVDKYQESLALLDVGDSVPNEEAMNALMMIEKQESGHGPDTAAGHE